MKPTTVSLMFMDIKDYSALTDPQLRAFMQRVLPALAGTVIDHHRQELLELNTWGDAVVAVSTNPYGLAHLALDARDFFLNRNWKDDHIPDLGARIALHAGVVYWGDDPVRRIPGVLGTQVNLAARIEPVTPPGEVWATEAFVRLTDRHTDDSFDCDDLGEQELAKSFGSARLFRVRRKRERPASASELLPPGRRPVTPPSAGVQPAAGVATAAPRGCAPEALQEMIRVVQAKYVKESRGTEAYQCFTDDDLADFLRNKVAARAAAEVTSDGRYPSVVQAVKALGKGRSLQFLEDCTLPLRPTFAELDGPKPGGQTEAGRKAEVLIAEAVTDRVRKALGAG